MRLKTQVINEKEAKSKAKDPRFMIKPMEPGLRGPNFEPVVLGGVAFYLDHVNKMAVPMKPTKLESGQGNQN